MEDLTDLVKNSCLDFAKNMCTAGIVWQDITSYSRYDKERIPTCFSTFIGNCKITIIFGHIYYPNQWIFNCYELGIKEFQLNASTAKRAAIESITICMERVERMHKEFTKINLKSTQI